MHPVVREARATVVPDLAGPHGPLPPLLLALTLVTGLVDSFSYLVLGHVFVANMTGNVVFMGFSLAGASGFSVTASVMSLAAFAVGAVLGGRLTHRVPGHRGRLLLAVSAGQVVLVVAAWVLASVADLPAAGGWRVGLVVLLALAMGGQNAVVRRLGVPDLSTTVLTGTITGVAADGRLAGGSDARAGTRLLSAAALFLGALAGAALIGHVGRELPLPVAAALLTGIAGTLFAQRRSTRAWVG
ncbi:YoaK family protein [Streptomyces sp. NPDC049040]|uniref:YoaK family protein n=1 Tax=Streptomyces sp. NPDC049040 TaxID=3365593 RepID=UPI003716A42D